MTDEIEKTSEKDALLATRRANMARAREARMAARAAKTEAPAQSLGAAAARTVSPRGEVRTRPDGRIEVTGHNGEILSRTRTQVGDIFEIPQSMIPKGWSYQWCAVTIAGNADIILDQNHMFHQNGWRPVPAERYSGTLVPKGTKGNIIRGQQMLMERPEALTLEAQDEDKRNAIQLMSDRNESLKLAGVKKAMPDGFAMDGRYKNTGGGVRLQIDKSLDVLNVNQEAGNYTLSE